jgi:hypothetical protein
VGVASIAAKENPVVQGVLVRDTLADGIDRVPFHSLPLDRVGLQNPLGGSLHFFSGRCLPWVEVGVGRRGDLDVKADHVVLAGDNHDGPMLGVNGTFHLGSIRTTAMIDG